ncbi:hypothetical protein GCM10022251_77170 [Phytohabitans flavus]|uniref:Uncharacterized protein n=2 Tax=Phytohabitans flavus TaxID=1076124 RepID=A0A6F8XLP5_9ACTN|nr:hypothetical protein Pflav_011190 [Phytohabitans flavus]
MLMREITWSVQASRLERVLVRLRAPVPRAVVSAEPVDADMAPGLDGAGRVYESREAAG